MFRQLTNMVAVCGCRPSCLKASVPNDWWLVALNFAGEVSCVVSAAGCPNRLIGQRPPNRTTLAQNGSGEKSPFRSLTLALYRYSSKRLAFFCFIALRILEAYSSAEMQSKPGIPASALHPSSEERNKSSFMEMPVLAESCFMNSKSIGGLPTRDANRRLHHC